MSFILLTSLIAGLFGLFFGSFSTVLIHRWREKKGGILFGRSECPHCRHILTPAELIPLFSYIIQGGKCRNCKTHIPMFYPLAELIFGAIFGVLTFAFLGQFGEVLTGGHITLLILGFVTGVYVLSDLRYMEIPDEIMVPGIYGYSALLLLGYLYAPVEAYVFDHLTYDGSYTILLLDHLQGAWILYTFLYLQILIPASWQLIKKKRYHETFDIVLSYITFPISLLMFWKRDEDTQHETEIITWVGGGDLRIALFIGLTLGLLHGVVAFMTAYIVGSIVGICILSLTRSRYSQVPFGPFLAFGWIISIFFHAEILTIATEYFSYL